MDLFIRRELSWALGNSIDRFPGRLRNLFRMKFLTKTLFCMNLKQEKVYLSIDVLQLIWEENCPADICCSKVKYFSQRTNFKCGKNFPSILITWHNGKNSQTEVGIWGRKENRWLVYFFLQIMAGVANIVRFKKTAPRDQISIPYWALSLSRVSYSLKKRQVETFLIVHTSSI